MATQTASYTGTALESRQFPNSKHIATKQHMAVRKRLTLTGVWELLDYSEYELINNSAVLRQVISTDLYDKLEVRVADTPDELSSNPTDVETVAGIADEIVTVAGIEAEVVTVAGIEAEVVIVAGDSAFIQDLGSEPMRSAVLDATSEPLRQAILDAGDYIGATQEEVWNAHAEALTAESSASQPVGEFTRIYTSAGDGITFPYTETTKYSALHYQDASEGTSSLSIGNIGKELMCLPLENSLEFSKGSGVITFTRPSTATYLNRRGVITIAGVGEPRFEKEGFLVEGASTNLCSNSEDLNHASYSKSLGIVVTQNQIVSPDGTVTMDKLTSNGVDSSNLQYRNTAPNFQAKYTWSGWIKKDDVDIITLVIYSGAFGFRVCTYIFSTNTFVSAHPSLLRGDILETSADGSVRLAMTMLEGNTDSFIEARLYPDDNAASTNIGSVYSWGWQFEEFEFATSYIPTGASAVTRAKETCTIESEDNTSAGVTPSTTIVDVHKKVINFITNEEQYVFRAENSTNYNCGFYGDTLGSKEGNEAHVGVTHLGEIEEFRWAVTNDLTTTKGFLNGELIKATANTTPLLTISKIFIGSQDDTWSRLHGHIKNLRTYGIALTDEEVRLA